MRRPKTVPQKPNCMSKISSENKLMKAANKIEMTLGNQRKNLSNLLITPL